MVQNQITEAVRDYYARVLTSNKDLKTSACCATDTLPAYQKEILAKIHPEVLAKFYGCGSPIPLALRGKTVLDLGCGSGRDVFMLSALVGASGHVIGVDMTSEQLATARHFESYHCDQFQLPRSNITWKHGFMEDLRALNIADNSIDVVVSNCVLNLSPDKPRVFAEIMRVLKPGGELYFSDVFAGRRIPRELQQDPVLLGECLGGALYVEDFRRLMRAQGVLDVRYMSKSPIQLLHDDIRSKLGQIPFYSATVRAFKIPLEDLCEDFGQVASYRGGMEYAPHLFVLDDHHIFEKNRPMLVCGNTADMLSFSRFAEFFEVHGNKSQHFGLFDCAPTVPAGAPIPAAGACC